MYTKPYDIGLIVRRFQTFTKGHEKLVETGQFKHFDRLKEELEMARSIYGKK